MRRKLTYVFFGLVTWFFLYMSMFDIANWITYDLLGLELSEKLSGAIAFFIFEVPIIIL